MRGYPTHINTRRDLEHAMAIDPARTKSLIQKWLDSREGWHTTAALSAEADGVTDETHRVVDQGDETSEWYQQEWGALPNNMLDRIGLSKSEAEAMLE